mmetsp:Transcript_5516/g.4199  ORF Transcript_5516/g.4199 Transcript_5516/m.4199 type:complete len:108 (+) Transcript_5516:413-736(+)
MEYFEHEDDLDDPFGKRKLRLSSQNDTDLLEEEKDQVGELSSKNSPLKRGNSKRDEELFSRITLKEGEEEEVRKSSAMVEFEQREKGRKYKDMLLRASRFTRIATTN